MTNKKQAVGMGNDSVTLSRSETASLIDKALRDKLNLSLIEKATLIEENTRLRADLAETVPTVVTVEEFRELLWLHFLGMTTPSDRMKIAQMILKEYPQGLRIVP